MNIRQQGRYSFNGVKKEGFRISISGNSTEFILVLAAYCEE